MSDRPSPRHALRTHVLSVLPYTWVVVALAAILQAGATLFIQGLPTLYPFIQEDMGLSRAQVGFITSSIAVGGLMTALVGGWLSDRWGVKRVSVAILGLSILPLLGISAAHFFWVILAMGVLGGATQAPGYPSSSRAIMDWLSGRTRGLAMSVKQTGVAAGAGLAALILPTVADTAGWRVGALVLAGMIFLAGVVFLAFYQDRPDGGRPSMRFSLAGIWHLAQERGLVVPALWAGAFVGLQFVVGSYLILFLVDQVGLSPVLAGVYMFAAQMMSIAARIVWGALSDFALGGRRIIVLAIMGLIASAGLAGASFLTESTPRLLALLIPLVVGFSAISWHGVFTVMVSELAGAAFSGTAVGVVNTVMRISVIVTPPLFGLLADVTGSYSSSWLAAAGVAFISTAMLAVFGRDPRRE